MIDAVRQVVREELPRLRKNFHVLASDRESRGHGSPITSGMTADVGNDNPTSFPAATNGMDAPT